MKSALAPNKYTAAEAEMAAKYRLGDMNAVAKIALANYGDELFGFLTLLAGNESDADELFSQLCERFWLGLPSFRWQSSLRTWLYVLARNEHCRYRNDAFRRRARPLSLSPDLQLVAQETRTRTANFRRTEVKDAFARLRDRLTAEERLILTLRIDRDMTWTDIAAVLSGTESTRDEGRESARVRKKYERIKQRLRKLAIEEGLLPQQ